MARQGSSETANKRPKVTSLGLKHKSEDELFSVIIDASKWSRQDRQEMEAAHRLAHEAHARDRHRDDPYIFHCLRVAARIPGYLHIYDREMIIAALLHDSVEDHADTVIGRLSAADRVRVGELTDYSRQQQAALEHLAGRFSARTSRIIAAVTNPAWLSEPGLDYEDKLAAYADKVEQAVTTPEGWLVKFSDWCDNGIGIVHREASSSVGRTRHFRTKYGLVAGTFKHRFAAADIQKLLDDEAKIYVDQQLRLADKRLIIGKSA